MLTEDQLRAVRRHLLDLDTAGRTGHQHGALRGPIQDEAQVQLAVDLEPLFHQQPGDRPPLRAGLIGHELHAQHLAGNPLGLGRSPGKLDAASLPATTGMNLGLDDDHVGGEALGDLARLRR